MKNLLLALSVSAFASLSLAPSPIAAVREVDVPWHLVEPLVGTWKGEGRGPAGVSEVELACERVLAGRFLSLRAKAVFAGNEAHPEGEVHEDWAMLSYDSGREVFVLRGFYSEGYVNTYVLDMERAYDGELVFTSESSENAPPGMRARLTMTLVEGDVLEESLELALPGGDFSLCVSTSLERRP